MHVRRKSRGASMMAAMLVAAALGVGSLLCVSRAGAQTSSLVDRQAKPKPSLKDEMRMPWQPPQPTGYLRDWLVLGPCPNPARPDNSPPDRFPSWQGFDTDFLKAIGGESAARPKAGQSVTLPDGREVKWTQYNSPEDIVDFSPAFNKPELGHAICYAYTTLRQAETGKAYLALGSDDGVKVFLNGQLVHDKPAVRGTTKDEDVVPIALQAGDNTLLVKVENLQFGCSFAVRVLTELQANGLPESAIEPRLAPAPADHPSLLVVTTNPARKNAVDAQVVHVEVWGPGASIAQAQGPRGQDVQFETRDWADGPYEVHVWAQMPDGRRDYWHLNWYKGDWLKQVRELLDDRDKLSDSSDEPSVLTRRMLGALLLDRLGRDPRANQPDSQPVSPPKDWAEFQRVLMEYRELQAGSAGNAHPYGFCRLAWRDDTDGTPQFARAYLPPGYDPKQAWPVLIALHGYNSEDPPYIRYPDATRRASANADRHNMIVIEPHGRGNTMYQGIGELDVLSALAQAKQRFNVDPDRVYLIGYSMGGSGTWHLGTAHPQLFAAIGPVYGGWDYHATTPAEAFAKLSPRERFEYEADSFFAQAESLLTTPVFINHGDKDPAVNVENSRYVSRMLQRWGYDVRYWEHPDMGHALPGIEDELITWLLAHRRQDNPRQVRVRTASLKLAAAHWVRVLQRESPLAFIHVQAEAVDRHTIRLDTQNVLELQLTPGAGLIDRGNPARVVWNGEDVGLQTFTEGVITLRAKGYAPSPLSKTPQLEGPAGEVLTTPFVIVEGTTAKDPGMRAAIHRQATAMVDHWKQWQHVAPRYVKDSEISQETLAKYSLVLIGGPEDNAVTARLIEKTPLRLAGNTVRLDDRSFEAPASAVSLIYPSPLNPQRYVQILAATSAAGMAHHGDASNALDFCILDGQRTPVVGGLFDNAWRVRDEYLQTRKPAAP